MAISPVADKIPLPSPVVQTAPAGSRNPTSAFELLLQNNRDAEGEISPEKAQAIAELMRLEQMRALMDPFAATASATESSLRPPTSQLIEAFRQQLPPTAETTAPATLRPELAPAPVTADAATTNRVTSSVPAVEPNQSLSTIIGQAAERYGVDERLIRAVIKAESNFNPRAVSHAGAQGLMQLMPATARGLGVTNSFDPYQNVMAGTRFLKEMLNRYHGNVDSALAAYNWGPGNVDRKGMAIPRETREYLAKVKTYYSQSA